MTSPALITEADAKRLARVAKSEGVSVTVKIGDKEITIIPNIPNANAKKTVELEEIEVL